MADYSEIHSEVRYYVPLNQSYEVWNLAVTNTSDRMRKINVTGLQTTAITSRIR